MLFRVNQLQSHNLFGIYLQFQPKNSTALICSKYVEQITATTPKTHTLHHCNRDTLRMLALLELYVVSF